MDKPSIERVLTGGNHLASALLGNGIDPAAERNTDYWVFLEKHGQPWADIFVAWKAIMELSEEQRNEHTLPERQKPTFEEATANLEAMIGKDGVKAYANHLVKTIIEQYTNKHSGGQE